MKLFAALLLSLVYCISGQRDAYEQLTHPSTDYPLPDLPYGYDELEPLIDTQTLKVHHLGHHKAYTDKMNAALKQWKEEVEISLMHLHKHILLCNTCCCAYVPATVLTHAHILHTGTKLSTCPLINRWNPSKHLKCS